MGEELYPGKSNPEASYEIDVLLETSESFLPKFTLHLSPNPPTEAQVRQLSSTHWKDLLQILDQ